IFFVTFPSSLTVLRAGPAVPLPNGCQQEPPPAYIGTKLRIRYQINDQSGSPLVTSMSGVHEDLLNLTVLGLRDPNFDVFDTRVIAGATDSDGTFVDVPIGVCGDPLQLRPEARDSVATFTQRLYVLVGARRFAVRTNDFRVRFRDDCAQMNNGGDIDVNTCAP